jgi:hypothetical protein
MALVVSRRAFFQAIIVVGFAAAFGATQATAQSIDTATFRRSMYTMQVQQTYSADSGNLGLLLAAVVNRMSTTEQNRVDQIEAINSYLVLKADTVIALAQASSADPMAIVRIGELLASASGFDGSPLVQQVGRDMLLSITKNITLTRPMPPWRSRTTITRSYEEFLLSEARQLPLSLAPPALALIDSALARRLNVKPLRSPLIELRSQIISHAAAGNRADEVRQIVDSLMAAIVGKGINKDVLLSQIPRFVRMVDAAQDGLTFLSKLRNGHQVLESELQKFSITGADARSSFELLGGLARAIGNPELIAGAKVLQATGSAAFQIGDLVAAFGAGKIAEGVLSGNVLSIAASTFSSILGVPSTDQLILQSLAAISVQLDSIGAQVKRIDSRFDTLHLYLSSQFAMNAREIAGLRAGQNRLAERIDSLESRLFAGVASLSHDITILAQAQRMDRLTQSYADVFGGIGTPDDRILSRASREFVNFARWTSREPAFSPRPIDHRSLLWRNAFPREESLFRNLNGFAHAMAEHPGDGDVLDGVGMDLATQLKAIPYTPAWQRGADAFVRLAFAHPRFATVEIFDSLLATGIEIKRTMRSLVWRREERDSSWRFRPTVVQALNDYKAAGQALAAQLRNMRMEVGRELRLVSKAGAAMQYDMLSLPTDTSAVNWPRFSQIPWPSEMSGTAPSDPKPLAAPDRLSTGKPSADAALSLALALSGEPQQLRLQYQAHVRSDQLQPTSRTEGRYLVERSFAPLEIEVRVSMSAGQEFNDRFGTLAFRRIARFHDPLLYWFKKSRRLDRFEATVIGSSLRAALKDTWPAKERSAFPEKSSLLDYDLPEKRIESSNDRFEAVVKFADSSYHARVSEYTARVLRATTPNEPIANGQRFAPDSLLRLAALRFDSTANLLDNLIQVGIDPLVWGDAAASAALFGSRPNVLSLKDVHEHFVRALARHAVPTTQMEDEVATTTELIYRTLRQQESTLGRVPFRVPTLDDTSARLRAVRACFVNSDECMR